MPQNVFFFFIDQNGTWGQGTKRAGAQAPLAIPSAHACFTESSLEMDGQGLRWRADR